MPSFPLNILILGTDRSLQAALSALPLPEGSTVSLEPPFPLPQGAAQADLVLFDGLFPQLEQLSPIDFPCSSERILRLQHPADPWEPHAPLCTDIWFPAPEAPASLGQLRLERLVARVAEHKSLTTSQVYLDTLINSIPDLVWFKDSKGAHLKVNEAFGRAVGKTPAQCENRGHFYIWDLEPEDYEKGEYICLETEDEVMRKRKTCLFDEKVLSKNGMRQFKTYKSPLFDKAGALIGTVGIAKDVTDLQNIVRELEVILESLPFGALIADEKDEILNLNVKFCEYFSTSQGEMGTSSYSTLCQKLFRLPPDAITEEETAEIAVRQPARLLILQVQQRAIHDIFGAHVGYFLLCVDMTTQHELQQQILHSANTDFLTGLYNRRYFYAEVLRRCREEPASLLYLDLDNFKDVNDTYGHQSGDRALVLTAKLLQGAFPNDLIARVGGDEFLVIRFGPLDPQGLEQEVASFLQLANDYYHRDRDFARLSLSAGIATETHPPFDLDALILKADSALYEAKSQGKSRYVIAK